MDPVTTTRDASQPAMANEPPLEDSAPRFRSGAVARMVRMPVATLRIWERRYHVSAPTTLPSGHRLYTAADVQRLALLKQLTDLGHAIGSIAGLSIDQLRQVATTHASTLTGARASPVMPSAPWRAALVGAGLAGRLARPAVSRRLGCALELVGPFDNLVPLIQGGAQPRVDLLLVKVSALHEGWLADLQAARDALGAPLVAVLYGYAAGSVCSALVDAGVALLREPQTDIELAGWLRGLIAPPEMPEVPPAAMLSVPGGALALPRYDDATLADIASLSPTIACECPRHVAELLMQLTHFEAYCADCVDRSPADAVLHGFLRQVAGSARSMFETALERVAVHEGLVLTRQSSDPAA